MIRKLLLAVVVGVLALTGTASAGQLPRSIDAHGPTLHPEGVAWDPTRQEFLVGSYPHGDISVVRADGRTRTLVHDPRVTSTFGLHVDAIRNRLLAVTGDGVGIFDLRTGRTLNLVKVGVRPNDLAIDWWGNAYVTDPGSDTIFRVDVHGKVTPQVTDPRLGDPSFGLNGIVWHPAGYLLAVRYLDGKLLRISLPDSGITEVQLAKPIIGGDGLALRPDGKLVVVTNNFGAPGGEDAVTVLQPHGLWISATVVKHEVWPIPAPTTVAVTPYGSYVLNGRLDWLIRDHKTSDEFFLTRA
ncbi:SMP-30/gluconolactonase/LRE family protein [Actinocrispum wychmicini]|uniref:Sugar lactone lactonase YvrE n=1 Tax=Actinocrispum wychmicini TaxID=1213861 RepID=A0A4R2KG51_9PSEU|nr:SMP-30/gluconolactonase/LRE family protein [Actinocrispum wychmicini]TCO65405.1 sugar lactone lactonase YvrE [Actinocrispum wychmicini]